MVKHKKKRKKMQSKKPQQHGLSIWLWAAIGGAVGIVGWLLIRVFTA